MTIQKKRLVTCPLCRQSTEYSTENAYRPFCSERCKMTDLGLWAKEEYTIPAPIQPNDLENDIL